MSRSVDTLRRMVLLLVLAAMVQAVRGAGTSGKREYDVAAGDAATTLRTFVEQSGEEIVYFVPKVRGVTTNAVKGEFTAREVIDRMLANTALVVVQDQRTGALLIKRATVPKPSKKASGQPNSTESIPQLPQSMKRRNPIAAFGAWLVLALSPAHVHAADSSPAAPQVASTSSIVGRVQNVATGQYLYNARVTVRGTDHVAFTNEVGAYRLVDIPSGDVIFEVMYTALDPAQASLQLPAGATLTRDFDLSSAGRYGGEGDVLKLGKFVVASSREMEGQALAVNEQRFSANIKNVLSSDTHGDVTQGSISEFLKHVSGITANYGDANADRISVRGLADNLTGITFDGAPIANSSYQGDTRAFHFTQVSINTISRVEVTKVPTPATPADSVGGSINMVSKTAFERSKPEFRYRAFVSLNSRDMNIRQTSFPYEEYNYKSLPGFDVSYINPVNERFGYVFTANMSLQYNPQDISTTTWRGATTTGTTVSASDPYLATYQFTDAPKTVYRLNSGLKLDWGVAKNSVLSLGLQANYHRDNNANNGWVMNAGTNGTPSVAGGVPLTYSPAETQGATGRGAVTMSHGHHHYGGPLLGANLRYRFEDANWRIDSGLSYSRSTSTFRYAKYGHFNSLGISLKEPAVRVVFSGIEQDKPQVIRAFANDGREIDLYDPDSYRINSATDNIRDISDKMKSADVNIRRELRSLPFGMAVQGGGSVRQQIRDNQGVSMVRDYVGPGGDNSATPYASQVFTSTSPFGFRPPWFSPRLAYAAWEKDASLFTMDAARLVSNETNRITRSEIVDETISALYLQTDLRLLKNRLRVLTGVRYEKTTDDARGPLVDAAAVWVRNPDGSFARDASGQRIRKPEAGAVGSMEQLRLTHQERGYRAHRTYDDFYPSLHLTYNVTENLLARFAWARTYGRPNFNEIIPNSTISENDVDLEDVDPEAGQVQGSISIRNTALRPWSADNFDFSLEYYTSQGGVFSAGVFVKEIKDFFGAAQRIATAADLAELGLDARYIGWRINTKFNAGEARVSGAEFNISQPLSVLGGWGRYFQVFANGIKLELDGGQEADWRGYVPELLNWGVTFTRNPITFMAKWQYRGESQDAPNANLASSGAFSRTAARTMLDLNLDYQISPKFSLFANARNIFNVRYESLAYGPETPDYARQLNTRNYGTQFALGVKGTF